MEGEYKVMLDATVAKEEEPTASVKGGSKITAALLAFTLCLAVAASAVLLLNRQAKGPGQEETNSDLHHKLRQISNVRAAIHLQGEHNPERKNSVEWKNQVDQSHSQGGLRLDNNEIVIPHSGLYFIYTQAAFRVSCSSGEADDTTSKPLVHLSQTVKRWSRTYGDNNVEYQTILHSIRTACQQDASSSADDGDRWFSTVYMGAVFNLNTGDRLKTEMEEKMLVNLEDDPGNTFFGVFAL